MKITANENNLLYAIKLYNVPLKKQNWSLHDFYVFTHQTIKTNILNKIYCMKNRKNINRRISYHFIQWVS